MTKHPIIASFVLTIGLSIVLAGVMGTVYKGDQTTFAFAAVFLLFPFVWFFVWMVLCGIGWWKETVGGRAADSDERREH